MWWIIINSIRSGSSPKKWIINPGLQLSPENKAGTGAQVVMKCIKKPLKYSGINVPKSQNQLGKWVQVLKTQSISCRRWGRKISAEKAEFKLSLNSPRQVGFWFCLKGCAQAPWTPRSLLFFALICTSESNTIYFFLWPTNESWGGSSGVQRWGEGKPSRGISSLIQSQIPPQP